MIDPIGFQLQSILEHLQEDLAIRHSAKKTNDVRKMRECYDQTLARCQQFQRVYPAYFPEAERLEPAFQALAECQRDEILTMDDRLTQFQSEIEWVQQHRSSFR
jgi:hypothetical protein